MVGGSSARDGAQCSCSLERSVISFSLPSVDSRTTAIPGRLLANTRWCNDFMPAKAFFLKNVEKYFAQSYYVTITSPFSVPTSWAWFTTADFSTTLAISAKHPILVRRKVCFNKPKHQSGANLVWPTIMNEISIRSFSPVRTRHVRYCIT